MTTQCSVCGKRVDADKHLIAEHKDKRGNVCYGSFTPIQNFDPFHVKRTPVIPGNPVGNEILQVDPVNPAAVPWPEPAYNYEYNGGAYDADFINEIRNLG